MTIDLAAPKITIGLPVFNGENFLEQAIDSVLNQTFRDFELIVRDNASSDRTEAICRQAALRDARVRYIRNASNIGAGPNFNGLVDFARGEYFKWLAHDDLMQPGFLEACVESLSADPTAVLACPRVRFIDQSGAPADEYVSPFKTDGCVRPLRFAEILKGGHRCFEIFGLIRLQDLRRTRLIGNYNNGDGVLLAHLALLGRFIEIPEHHFLSRRHPQSSMYVFRVTAANGCADLEGYAHWFDPRNKIGLSKSFSRTANDLTYMISATAMSSRDRWDCYKTLIAWLGRHWRSIAGEWKRVVIHTVAVPIRFHGR